MKRGILVALLLVAAGKDEDAIKKVQDDFSAAWGKPDAAKNMAAMFAEDGDVVNPVGEEADGRAAVEQLFTKEQGTVFKGSTLTLTPGKSRMIKPDVAIGEGKFEVTGAHTPDGKPLAMKGLYTIVLVKAKGKWWISAIRPMVPAPAGPPPGAMPPKK